MTLKTLFAVPVTIILLVTLSLAGMMAGEGWSGQTRGKQAVEAVEDMRLLLLLQSDLRSERVATNFVLGKTAPMPEPALARLAAARTEVDRRIAAVARRLRGNANGGTGQVPEPYLVTLMIRVGMARAAADRLRGVTFNERSFTALNEIQPMMIRASQALEQPTARVGLEIVRIDPGLSGLLTQERLATSLRDHVGLTAAVVLPRVNNGERLTAEDVEQVRVLAAQSAYLLGLLRETIEFSGATDRMRAAIAALERVDRDGMSWRLIGLAEPRAPVAADDYLPAQGVLVRRGEQVNVLRIAIVNELVARVTSLSKQHERVFDLLLTGLGLVLIAILESIFLLRRRVVKPLAELGSAIARIAAGDRSVPLVMRSETREISDMVTAVETLRQAALVADAAALRQRMAAQQRLQSLREAIHIARTVREPARALERDVEQLSEGIDATIALVGSPSPPTLATAAEAVRAGLAELRRSSPDMDTAFASDTETEDRPEAEFVAHVLAVKAEVDRRDVAVRGFVQHGLAALRDAAAESTRDPVLRDLVSEQFERLEQAVASMASMQAAVRRAAAILRDLPLQATPLAA